MSSGSLPGFPDSIFCVRAQYQAKVDIRLPATVHGLRGSTEQFALANARGISLPGPEILVLLVSAISVVSDRSCHFHGDQGTFPGSELPGLNLKEDAAPRCVGEKALADAVREVLRQECIERLALRMT